MSLYLQDIRCVTEGQGVSRWMETEDLLTSCPNDPAHEVLDGSARILDVKKDNVVYISKEKGFKTNNHIRVESFTFDVEANGERTITQTWPIDIAIYSVSIAAPASAQGCLFTAIAGYRTPVGYYPGELTAGDLTVAVSPTVVSYVDPGYHVGALRPDGRYVHLGIVTNVNKATNVLTLLRAVPEDIPAGTTCTFEAHACSDLEIAVVGQVVLGADRDNAMHIPPGTSIQCTVKNPHPAPTHVVVYCSFAY